MSRVSCSVLMAGALSWAAVEPAAAQGAPPAREAVADRNSSRTRLILAPTGRMLEEGERYFSDFMLIVPGVSVGVTDEFTMGIVAFLLPALDLEDPTVILTPKLGILASDMLAIAVGANIRPNLGEIARTGGTLYAVATVGDEKLSITSGVAVGFVGVPGMSGFESPVVRDNMTVGIGGQLRLSADVGLVTEIYLPSYGLHGVPFDFALRFFGEKTAFDAGVVGGLHSGRIGLFPIVGFTINY